MRLKAENLELRDGNKLWNMVKSINYKQLRIKNDISCLPWETLHMHWCNVMFYLLYKLH